MASREMALLRCGGVAFPTLLVLLVAASAGATSSSKASASPMAGNGHNITFDGKVFIARRGDNNQHGWYAMVLRPGKIAYVPHGLNLNAGALSPPVQISDASNGENALAMCETSPDSTPYACDEGGAAAAGGPFACYDLYVFDSNAEADQYNGLRRRQLKVWIASPDTDSAVVHKHQWIGGMIPVTGSNGADFRGIEPTVTRDGHLMIWQGHPANKGKIDILMYASSDEACAVSWDGPHNLSHLYVDPKTKGKYPLAEKQLRAADGTPFQDGEKFRGAYPWLFGEGDALIFTSVNLPCKSPENPPGCGPRRGGLAVIGYPTNWGIGHIDGALNPATDDHVRLFFSSPGPKSFPQLPVTSGADVWPFFGSNTANFGDVVFDDALDGQYAGVWLMNESVNTAGKLDLGHSPDSGGYFNTAEVHGAVFPKANNGLFGKALVFGGDGDRLKVPHSKTLNPVNAITVELWLRPQSAVDCDGNNNYRVLLAKGPLGPGAYSLILEEGEILQARVLAGGVERSVAGVPVPLPIDKWSHVGFTYDGATGAMRLWVDGALAGEASHPPAVLDGSKHALTIGGPGGARPKCPNTDGSFHGLIEEARISRVVRDLSVAARPGNRSRFVQQQVPLTVAAGQPFSATFTFRNVGTHAWSSSTAHVLGAQSPQDNSTWGTGRVALPAGRFETGETVLIPATLTAPATPGTYAFQWRVLQEGSEWFGEFSEPLELAVVDACPGGCDDADACTVDSCDATANACVYAAAVDCGDGFDCTVDLCDAVTAECSWDDAACECQADEDCDDADPLTTDTCRLADRTCLFVVVEPDPVPDAGPEPAAAEAEPDAPAVDAGIAAVDTNTVEPPPAETIDEPSTGGCSSVPGSHPWLPVLLLVLAAAAILSRRRA